MIGDNVDVYPGRYVFVAGLHRTGTSLLTRLLGHHPDIAQITGAPVPENEGCFLQGGIAHTARHGIPGHFATDPAQHLIEGCAYDDIAVRQRMEADWHRWFGSGETWRIEKSPVNLTRMRLYQQIFPLSQFIVILRHPEAMAAALAKWTDAPSAELIDYALDAYDLAMADVTYLHSVLVVRYEDLVKHTSATLSSAFGFLDLKPVLPSEEVRCGNADYPKASAMSAGQQERAERFGYGAGLAINPFAPIVRHPLRSIREKAEAALRDHRQ